MDKEYENLKDFLEKFKSEISDQLKNINQRQDRIEKEITELLKEKIIISGEIPTSPIPAKKLLEIFTQSLHKLQQEIAEAPGIAKFSIGTFRPNVKATISYDKDGELILNLPQPGDRTPPEVLSDINFIIQPIPWEPSIAANEVMVPTLIGLTFDLAKSKIEELGLVLGDISKEQTDTPSDIVLRQDPAAGLIVLKGSKINLTISEHVFVEVPLVVGLHVDDAKNVLKNAGLGYEIRSEIESDQPVGQVLSQEPLAGEKVRREAVVKLDISKGPSNQVEVPDIVGKTLDEAKYILESSELEVGSIIEIENEAQQGTVIQQKPSAGTVVVKKTKINLTVSKGLLVEVPNVVGLQVVAAINVLKSLGFKSEIRKKIESERPVDEVIIQEPSAGTRVTKQSMVMLDISKGIAEKVQVPEVVGMLLEQAISKIIELGLKVGKVNKEDSNLPEDTVLHQVPKSGSSVFKGTDVNLTISKGNLVEVPEVVGKNLDKAMEILKSVTLKAKVQAKMKSDRPANEVLKQAPKAGELVRKNSVVKLHVSSG